MATVTPFDLCITVIGARNVPVADVTTSDPYVVIYLNDVQFARTRTIYRNCSPDWNEFFRTKILHRNSKLEFRLYDEDENSNPDFLGSFEVDLNAVPVSKTFDSSTFEVNLAPKYRRGRPTTMDVSIIIGRKESLISMVPLQVAPTNEEAQAVAEEQLQRLQAEEGWAVTSAAVRETFCDLSTEGVLADFSGSAGKDLLYDVASVLEESAVTHTGSDYSATAARGEKLLLRNGSLIDLETGEIFSHPPIEANSTQINVVDAEGKTTVFCLHFHHRYALWLFASWILLADKLWSGRLKRHRLPAWMEDPLHLQVRLTVSGSQAAKALDGRVSASVDQSYTLRIHSDSISLVGMRSIVLSADSLLPGSRKLFLSLLDLRLTGDEHAADGAAKHDDGGGAREPHATERRNSSSHSFPVLRAIGSTVKGAAKGLGTVVSTTATTAKETANLAAYTAVGAVNVAANTAVGAAKTIASGDPLKMLRSAGETVVDVSSTLASTISAAPGAVFGRNPPLLLVRAHGPDKALLLAGDGHSGGCFCLDFEADADADAAADVLPDVADDEGRAAVVRRAPGVTSNPPRRRGEPSLELSLLSGSAFDRKPLVQGRVPLANLLAHAHNWRHSEGASFRSTVTLVHSLEFVVRLVSAKGLSVPADHRAVSLFAKARFVDAHGHSHKTDFVEDFTFQSPTVAVSPNPLFHDHKFVLRSADRFDKQDFVRVELFLDYVAVRASLGAAFIPLSYFDAAPATYTFPVSKHTRSQHGIVASPSQSTATGAAAAPAVNAADLVNISLASVRSQAADLGTVTVKIHCVERPEKAHNAVLEVAGTVRSAGLMDSAYFAEGVPSSAHNAAADSFVVEQVAVAALPDGLKLIELDGDAVGRETLLPSSSGRASSLSVGGGGGGGGGGGDEAKGGSAKSDDRREALEVEIEVFENQRRSPYPPFDWSSSAITRPRFSNLDYSVGYDVDRVESAQPPEGFEWAGDWLVDLEPLGPRSAGKDGWMYSFTFGKLLDNYRKRWSHTDPFNTHARRRRFVRRARALGDDPAVQLMTARDALIAFQVANSKKRLRRKSSSQSSGGLLSAASSFIAAGGGGGGGGGATAAAPAGDSQHGRDVVEDWRRRRADQSCVLGGCEEKAAEFAPILLPWEQVQFADVVSASVLVVGLRVNRCLGSASRGYSYRPSDVHLFVSNCPAHELKSLIDERKMLVKTRQNLRRLIASGNVFGSEQHDVAHPADAPPEEDAEEGVPETEELSLASEIAADLDAQIAQIQAFVRKLERSQAQVQAEAAALQSGGVDDPARLQTLRQRAAALRKEASVLKRRLCRLRLYLAALYGVGLQGAYAFDEQSVRRVVDQDLRRVSRIAMEDAVATANNRIEFLLDVAEKRIRDVALCGWSQPAQLQRCAELYANCYLTEIINVLGAFFEDRALMSIKGLGGKIELIRTYMKHNDRLDHILESAFRPYRLRAEPAALLSLCLDFDQLIAWYASSLNSEMRQRVDNVFALWKTQSRADSNVADQFFREEQLLPWYPSMSEGRRRFFFCGMPTELQAVLVQYLAVARIRREQVAVSFKDAIGRLDAKVCLAYANAFLYLAESYQSECDTLQTREWAHTKYPALTRSAELEERMTWLASVANDLQRSVHSRVFEVAEMLRGDADPTLLHDAEVKALSGNCLAGLYRAQEAAASQAIELMTSQFFEGRDLSGDAFFQATLDGLFAKADGDAAYFATMAQRYREQVFAEFEEFFEEGVACSLWQSVLLQLTALLCWFLLESAKATSRAKVADPQRLCRLLAEELRLWVEVLDDAPGAADASVPAIVREQPEPQQLLLCPLVRKRKLLSEVAAVLPVLAALMDADVHRHVEASEAELQRLRDVAQANAVVQPTAVASLAEAVLALQGLDYYQHALQASLESSKSVSRGRTPGAPSTPKAANASLFSLSHQSDRPPSVPDKRKSIFGALMTLHLPSPFSTDRHAATATSSHDSKAHAATAEDDDGGVDAALDEEVMKHQLQVEKERAIAACFDIHLGAMKQMVAPVSARPSDESRSVADPVFSAMKVVSLEALLFEEKNLMSSRVVATATAGQKLSGSMASISRFFSVLGKTDSTAAGQRHLHYAALVPSLASAALILDLSDLAVSNMVFVGGLFSLGIMHSVPKPYLRVVITAGQRCLADTHTDILDAENVARGNGIVDVSSLTIRWSNDLSIPILDASVSQFDVCIRLCYAMKTYDDDHVLGSVHFSFSPFDNQAEAVKRVVVIDYADASSALVRNAIREVLQDNRNLPSIAFSFKCRKGV